MRLAGRPDVWPPVKAFSGLPVANAALRAVSGLPTTAASCAPPDAKQGIRRARRAHAKSSFRR